VELRKKKEENCIAPYCKEREVGDAYTYLGFKRKTQFIICFVVGKWNDWTCDLFYALLAKRVRFPTRKRRITIFSDGNKQNFTGIAQHFPQGTINYGLRKKIKKGQKIVGIVSKVIYGIIPKDQIGITEVDGFCSKLRERISCFTRKARSFAKRKLCIEQRLEIFSIQHNFIEKKKGKTPAMREGICEKPLAWNTLFQIRLSYLN
jgi:hypothetical protein